MYQMIAFDMDGTLLDSRKQIRRESREAIARACLVGKTVVLNTGRCMAELEEYFSLLPGVRYVNSVSGALVYDLQEKRVLSSQLLDVEKVAQILRLAETEQAMPHIMLQESIIQKSHWEQMECFGMAVYKEMFARVAVQWDDLAAAYAKAPFPAAKVNIYHRSPASMRRTRKRMEEMALDVTMAEAERTSLEMTARGVDKGTGLENLCRMLDLPLAQVIVVGDADNDLGSLQKAGLAVAMGNANEAVRAAADVIVADCDHGGCVEAIEKYLLDTDAEV